MNRGDQDTQMKSGWPGPWSEGTAEDSVPEDTIARCAQLLFYELCEQHPS